MKRIRCQYNIGSACVEIDTACVEIGSACVEIGNACIEIKYENGVTVSIVSQIGVSQIGPTAEITERIRPVYNFKAAE